MKLLADIMPTIKSSWVTRHGPPRRPCFAGVSWPWRALAIQAMAVETPIPNRAAADRADIPSFEAANTRLRKSSLKARLILLPIKLPVRQWNQKSTNNGILNPIPPSMDML